MKSNQPSLNPTNLAQRTLARVLPTYTPVSTAQEWAKCQSDPTYFITHYCQIENPQAGGWSLFTLWPEQREVIETLKDKRLVAILKARQVGLTWSCLGFALWLMTFQPIAAIGIYSRRETEAIHLLTERLRGMWSRLPDWMKPALETDNAKLLRFANGSTARAMPTTAGDTYTFTYVLVDEADLMPDLDKLLTMVKPTIDNGGRLTLLSKSNKRLPASPFKATFKAAVEQLNDYTPIFLSWRVHPNRDDSWYAAIQADIQNRTGAIDELYENYPETIEQALAPRQKGVQFPLDWLTRCYYPQATIEHPTIPPINDLLVYALPVQGYHYAIGIDPAEGKANSNDSSLHVVMIESGAEVAKLAGKIKPHRLAEYAATLARFYGASVLCERNNHGHAVLMWIEDNAPDVVLLDGLDGSAGWQTNTKSKAVLYSKAVELVQHRQAIIHSASTFQQLASIEESTLAAPEDMPDDEADSFAFALYATLVGSKPSAGNLNMPVVNEAALYEQQTQDYIERALRQQRRRGRR